MATHPKGPVGSANGANESELLRILAAGNVLSDTELQTAMSKQLSPRWFPKLAMDMQARGLIARSKSTIGAVWHITEQGRAKLPSAPTSRWDNFQPLQRDRVVRREGSDVFRTLPSMAAGKERAWRHPA